MKNTHLILSVLLGITVLIIIPQCGRTTPVNALNAIESKSIGIVIYSNDVETVWNALRFANYSKNQGDSVNIFLLGKGVELDDIVKSDSTVKKQADKFLNSGGTILGCGTCLKSRNNNEPKVCKFSSMKELYEMVHKNKIVMTF